MTTLKLILCIVIVYSSCTLFGQREDTGVFLSLGLGVGYSTYGQHYFETRPGVGGSSITEFSGFRAVILNAKLGYMITDEIGLSAKYLLIPGATTVSPIASTWLGGNLSFDIPNSENYYVYLGAGQSQSKISDNRLSSSILYNVGFGIRMGEAIVEFEVYTGQMEEKNSLDPNPFEGVTFEIMPSISFSYVFAIGNTDD